MRKTLRYMLYATVCIVMLIIVLISLWLCMAKPYTKEDFIVPAPYVVMAGISSTGAVYYADVDVPINPRWVNTGLTAIGNIAGSYGQLYSIPSAGGAANYGPYDSSTPLARTTMQVLKYISVDDNGTLVGLDGSNSMFYGSSGSGTFSGLGGKAKSVAVSASQLFAVGEDNSLKYYQSSKSLANPVTVTPGGKTSWKQVTFDGTICALETDGTLWCAGSNISDGTQWTQQGSRKFNWISIRGGRLVGIATDGKPYYSNTSTSPTWVALPTQEYNGSTGALLTGNLSFSTIILFYPSMDARRRRFLGTASACSPDEQQIGSYCYARCISGRDPVGTKCPFRRKQTPPIATCTQGVYINGACYTDCPSGTIASGQMCIGNPQAKQVLGPNTNVEPARFNCPTGGALAGRYVRIRPTNLIQNNKLCLSKVVVTDVMGQVISTVKPVGTMSGAWMGSVMPITMTKMVSVPGKQPVLLYVVQDTRWVKMVADDAVGTAKYYDGGSITTWSDSYWTNGTSAGTKADGRYVVNLAGSSSASAVTASATDGTCADAPIGGRSCTSQWSTYLSSSKYDTDPDGGKVNRATKTYWELDLGSVQLIKTIEITGCKYITAAQPESSVPTAVESTGVSQPGADQITGMQVEVLYNANKFGETPVTSRSLGPQINQTITFNYLTRQPGVDDTCYDDCPSINGVVSVDGGQQNCIAASGGITSRSITSPVTLPPPVCGPPVTGAGNPYVKMTTSVVPPPPSIAGSVGNWVLDQTNPSRSLSCENLPGSTLMPLSNTYNIPVMSSSSPATITYNLQRPDNTLYTNTATPHMCVIMDDSLCEPYNVNGTVYKLRGGLCVRMDVSPDFDRGDRWWDGGAGNTDYRYSGCGAGLRNDGTACWEDGACTTWCREGGGRDLFGNCYAWDLRTHCSGCACIKYYQYGICNDSNREYINGFCYSKCPAGTHRHSTLLQWCKPNSQDPHWGARFTATNSGITRIYRYALRAPRTLYDLAFGNPVVSTPSKTTDDFTIPLIPDTITKIVPPDIFPSNCKCLKPDGTLDKNAYIYNNTCVKCANPNAVFYSRGTVTNDGYEWSEEKKGMFLSPSSDNVSEGIIDQKPFTNIDDAKKLCESDEFCKGITRRTDSDDIQRYYLSAGSTPISITNLIKGSVSSNEVYIIAAPFTTKALAQSACESFAGTLATKAQLQSAFRAGAEWCSTGWISDETNQYYPMQKTGVTGCSEGLSGPTLIQKNQSTASATCYGIKPQKGTTYTSLSTIGSAGSSRLLQTSISDAPIKSFNEENLIYKMPTPASARVNDSCWVKGAPIGGTKVPNSVGLYEGHSWDTVDIPRVFADDYVAPSANSVGSFFRFPTGVVDIINKMSGAALRAAGAWSSFQNSVQNPNTYYQLTGIERKLVVPANDDNKGIFAEKGICVGPCDPEHTLHDPIQMIYDHSKPGVHQYMLFGTTCHDSTEVRISKPSIPAIYTPQKGADCNPNYTDTMRGSNKVCIEQCNSSQNDSGSSCSKGSVDRPYIAAQLSCPEGLKLVGGTCLHNCGAGYTEDGDYCEPIISQVNVPSTIKCVSTPAGYSSKYHGSGNNIPVKKWMCDTEDDMNALIEGPSDKNATSGSLIKGASTYINESDVVCYADDASTGMYYCQSIADAIAKTPSTNREDYSATCNALIYAYSDLSNNLTAISSRTNLAQNAQIQVAAIQATLQKVVQNICGSGTSGTSGSVSSTCNALRIQLGALNSNINAGSGILSGILSPVTVALSSRDKLVNLLRDMKCCKPGSTKDPWC